MTTDDSNVSIAMPGEWALKRAFGPVLEDLGQDLRRLYASGRDKILRNGYQKIQDPDDGKRANLRVTRDVLWNGSVAEEEVCAEYFGGILAASRSTDGRDDSTIEFVDSVKALASRQLLLHYFVYSGLNELLCLSAESVNVAVSSEINARPIYFSSVELNGLGIDVSTDFNVLFRRGLLSEYRHDTDGAEEPLPYASANPTTYGVLLFAASLNRTGSWTAYSKTRFAKFKGIRVPRHFAPTVADLREKLGLPPGTKKS